MMSTVRNWILQSRQGWEKFWWADVDPLSLKMTRIVLGTAATFLYTLRFWQLNWYDERSLIPKSSALDLMNAYQKPLFSWNFWPDSWAIGIQIVFLFLLILFTLGYTRRPLMILMWTLHVGFMHRNFAAAMGVDTMVTVFMFYLSFCEVWKKRGPFDLLTRTMVRMAQVHLSVIYFYTGVEKLRGASWWEGSSLWFVFNNQQMTSFNMEWTVHMPSILALIAHLTVLFEIFFIPLVFNSKTKFYILTVGLFFHLGIALVLGLWAFSAIMLAPYFLFVTSDEWKILRQRLGHRWQSVFQSSC